jgi:hypothetical protein
MMPMHFPYGNTNTAGHHLYGTGVCPNFGINYNQYFASFYSNSNGLLPIPSIEGNKNLNIHEYKPIIPKNLLTNSSSTSFRISQDEKNDFLTFIEQKSKPISELNPFANEFSLVKNTNNQIVSMNNEKSSSYKLIFDDLIEQSLQSIEAIKKASKYIFIILIFSFILFILFNIEQFLLIMFLHNVINQLIKSTVQHKQMMIMINTIYLKNIVHIQYVFQRDFLLRTNPHTISY